MTIAAMKAYPADYWPHGNRNRYQAGCRCSECRGAQAAYMRLRRLARKCGEPNDLVSAGPVKRHLRKLQRQGVGRDAVAEATDIPYSTITRLRKGLQTHLRVVSERKILAVTRAQALDGATVDATKTWALIAELREEGYEVRFLAKQLGFVGKGLPFGKKRITVRNANRVELLHRKLTNWHEVKGVSARAAPQDRYRCPQARPVLAPSARVLE